MFERIKMKYNGTAPEWLIVGLGNIGPKYENTRHNAGFICIDEVARSLGVTFSGIKMKSELAFCEIAGKRCILAKPQTFMNLSGEAVFEISKFYKIDPSHIIIISDDINLDVGGMRIRKKGSDGGQRGLRSIIQCINSEDFPRIRVGVGKKPHPDFDLAAWVTSKFSSDERKLIDERAKDSVGAVECIVKGDFERAMSLYNKSK